jgi:ATP-dependent RNA helicase CshB
MKFTSFNLKPEIIKALNSQGYYDATPVQDVVIPKALKNENIIVQSETGSGKTHAFIVPIINNLIFNEKIQAIIISPTRELARQTYDFIVDFKKYLNALNCKLFISGEDQSRDIASIKNGCQIIVATPGRLNFLKKYLNKNNSEIKTIILDEADMLMDQDFMDDIDGIIAQTNHPQIEVYSATIDQKVEVFLKKYISPDYVLTLNEKNSTSSTVKHYLLNTRHANIKECVHKFIKIKNPYLLMIFTNSQDETMELYKFLNGCKYKCGIISGELQPRERKSMLRRIKNDEFEIIVCTDIASRGLDIQNVTDVLSTDLPNNIEYYYHRAGRSGRNYKSGNSYVLYDLDHLKNVSRLLDDGVKFEYLKFGDDELIPDKPIEKEAIHHKKKVNQELERDIKKAAYEARSKGVKPGYKRKIKLAVERVRKKHKREIIRKDIRRQMTERYRAEGRKDYDDER